MATVTTQDQRGWAGHEPPRRERPAAHGRLTEPPPSSPPPPVSVWRSLWFLVGAPTIVTIAAAAWLVEVNRPVGAVALAASAIINALGMFAVRHGARVIARGLAARELAVQWVVQGVLLAGIVALYRFDWLVAAHVLLGGCTVLQAISCAAISTPEKARALLDAARKPPVA